MTLNKAIEILENTSISGATTRDPDYMAALRLAIQIMKLIKVLAERG